MCREIEIYHTGNSPILVVDTISAAVDYFGLDAVRKHVVGLGYNPSGIEKHCLCGIDIEELCTESGYTIICEDDRRWSAVNLAVAKDSNEDIRPWVQIGEAMSDLRLVVSHLVDSETMAELVREDGAICSDCARDNSAEWPEGHQASFWTGKCCVCGRLVGCCSVSDWNWPKVSGPKASREF
jgi:hypothetical protein